MEATDPLPVPRYRIGLTYNLKKGIHSEIEDIEAEYDSIETVTAIKQSLEKLGAEVLLLEADPAIFGKLTGNKIDIVFNIAEGTHGRGREAEIPAILNYLGIPFVGSDETTLCIALDKSLTKRIISTYGIKTPGSYLVNNINDFTKNGLKFPVIVKPNAEGSSKGIPDFSTADDAAELKKLVARNISAYRQSMLVEEYITGREFTVGIVGNGSDVKVFPPMEIHFAEGKLKRNVYSYTVKKNYKEFIEYRCPAPVDKDTDGKIRETAAEIFKILECRDFARMDFRMSEDGEIHFIEINPLPGLAPGYSDFPMIAGFTGIDYDTLIRMILNSALKRLRMTPV